ncbi:L,D-transpeptidase family protein [Methylocystis sp. JAN1]|uniref:L,D-transpeptidase family protein n=1 Tax=Methylocystis sp. JAN1 TaxID=3397211 RepID=UPI003FA220FA
MKPRSTYLLLAAVALGALAMGVAALRFLPAAGGRGGAGKAALLKSLHPAGGSILPGLRRAAPPPVQAPAPSPPTVGQAAPAAPIVPPAAPVAAAPPATQAQTAQGVADGEHPPIPELEPSLERQTGVEGLVSFPPVAPVPPARPAELRAAETIAPLPPIRPRDLAALETPAQPAPLETAQPQAAQPPAVPQHPVQPPATGASWFPQWPSAPQAPMEAPQTGAAPAPVYVSAPLPPTRPADLDKLASLAPAAKAVATESASAQAPAPPAAAGGGQQTARLEEPTLRPAPEDAFQAPPPKFGMGDPVFMRIFKQEGQLELWLKKNGRYSLYKTFPICKWSGRLGPKLKEADYQSPEGFYSVSAKQLNPHSNYYRAFNVGYPNAFDRQNGRTGGLVMVHGACKSVGCFAMTDRGIEEIYGFVEAALKAGQKEVPVHIFPFRMTEANIARETGGGWLAFVGGGGAQQWAGFWKNLKEGYDLFEQTGQPPVAFACGDHYEFDGGSSACKRVAGW